MNAHPQFAEALALYAMGALDDPQERAAWKPTLAPAVIAVANWKPCAPIPHSWLFRHRAAASGKVA